MDGTHIIGVKYVPDCPSPPGYLRDNTNVGGRCYQCPRVRSQCDSSGAGSLRPMGKKPHSKFIRRDRTMPTAEYCTLYGPAAIGVIPLVELVRHPPPVGRWYSARPETPNTRHIRQQTQSRSRGKVGKKLFPSNCTPVSILLGYPPCPWR